MPRLSPQHITIIRRIAYGIGLWWLYMCVSHAANESFAFGVAVGIVIGLVIPDALAHHRAEKAALLVQGPPAPYRPPPRLSREELEAAASRMAAQAIAEMEARYPPNPPHP